ncbi:hypothetical protein [Sphaerimonospora mesophila]|uniref:hypothetical protein n=1 Tax=Sphaerimonospora mesophila TaxID=37483 RepID=UPI0006E1C423
MAYSPYPIIEADVDDLFLDLDNYRVPTRSPNEAAALKYLFASEDVMGAARLILREGYFDNEVPIVMAVSSGYVVLEGNRRVSALKALRDPSLVPAYENEVRALLRRYQVEAQSLPTAIRVIVVPDRETAAPHIARLHTGLSKRRWSRDQQATFYYSLLDTDTTVDDVKAQYPDVEVVRFIRMAVTRKFLAAVHFNDHSLRTYAAGDDLKMSAFEYAYRHKSLAAAIGIEFDRDGHLLPRTFTPEQIASALPPHQLAAVEYLLNQFRANKLNTRSQEFKKDTDEYNILLTKLESFGQPMAAPTASGGTSPSPTPPPRPGVRSRTGGSPGGPGPGGTSNPARTPRGPNHPNTKTTLDLSGVDYSGAGVNLKTRYIELRAINVVQFPAATAMLLRSVLEGTIKFHFESTASPVTGELSRIFPRVIQDYGNIKALKSSINTISSGNGQTPGSIQWFNVVSHSADAVVLPNDVRTAWQLVNPLIRHLLRPLGQSTP